MMAKLFTTQLHQGFMSYDSLIKNYFNRYNKGVREWILKLMRSAYLGKYLTQLILSTKMLCWKMCLEMLQKYERRWQQPEPVDTTCTRLINL